MYCLVSVFAVASCAIWLHLFSFYRIVIVFFFVGKNVTLNKTWRICVILSIKIFFMSTDSRLRLERKKVNIH